ncbi:MAG: SxtJ family membrane protein [Planctomycetota bacterium]|nr:SxtJ family membrane protein [Planctomycetota bacterium]
MHLSDIPTNPSKRFLRQFAAGSVVFLGLIGTVWWFRGHSLAAIVLWAVGASIGAAGLVYPRSLRWVYVAIAVVSLPIGFIVSTAVLLATYLLALTPIGCIMRLLGRDSMGRRFDPAAESYWQSRAQTPTKRYFRQF